VLRLLVGWQRLLLLLPLLVMVQHMAGRQAGRQA
jgi:hypothetical protein